MGLAEYNRKRDFRITREPPGSAPAKPRYTEADVEMVRAAVRLLETGLPLPDLLAIARRYHDATREFAEGASNPAGWQRVIDQLSLAQREAASLTAAVEQALNAARAAHQLALEA